MWTRRWTPQNPADSGEGLDEVRSPRTGEGGARPPRCWGWREPSREQGASSEALLDRTDPRLREDGPSGSPLAGLLQRGLPDEEGLCTASELATGRRCACVWGTMRVLVCLALECGVSPRRGKGAGEVEWVAESQEIEDVCLEGSVKGLKKVVK